MHWGRGKLMATKLRVPCAEPGCSAIVAGGRCERHQKPPPPRPRFRDRAYGPHWRRIRLQVLAEQPLCACGARATQVDHIIPLKDGGTNDRANLVASCKPCHSRKTAKHDGGFGNAKRTDG